MLCNVAVRPLELPRLSLRRARQSPVKLPTSLLIAVAGTWTISPSHAASPKTPARPPRWRAQASPGRRLRTGPIGPDRCQYNLLNPRGGIMMRIMQSFHTRARRRRNARVPVDIWRKPSGPTAPRSGNMSFSHCPARHPRRRMKCNSGRSQFLPLQSSNVYVYKFSQSGCRFISKSIGQKIKLIARPISISHVFSTAW